MQQDTIMAYADGGIIRVNPSPYGGTFAWVHQINGEIVRQESGVVSIEEGLNGYVTNNVSELYALCRCIQAIPDGSRTIIHSDSNVSLLRVFSYARTNNVPDSLLTELDRAQRHLRKMAMIEYVLLDGHPTKAQLAACKGKRGAPVSEWNVYCDALCTAEGLKHQRQQAASL